MSHFQPSTASFFIFKRTNTAKACSYKRGTEEIRRELFVPVLLSPQSECWLEIGNCQHIETSWVGAIERFELVALKRWDHCSNCAVVSPMLVPLFGLVSRVGAVEWPSIFVESLLFAAEDFLGRLRRHFLVHDFLCPTFRGREREWRPTGFWWREILKENEIWFKWSF